MELRVTLGLGASEAALRQMWHKLSMAVEPSGLAGGKGIFEGSKTRGDGEEQVCAQKAPWARGL